MRSRDPYLYMTDFSEYKTGQQPGDWSFEYNSSTSFNAETVSGSISGTAVRWTKASGRQGIRWTRVPLADHNVEILLRFRRIVLGSNTNNIVGPYWQGAGSSGTETGMRVNIGVGNPTTTLTIQADRYFSGSVTTAGLANIIGGSNANEWIWARIKQSGQVISTAYWKQGDPEAALSTFVSNASYIIGTGWVGLQSVTAPTTEIDFFGVGLNGRTVPLP